MQTGIVNQFIKLLSCISEIEFQFKQSLQNPCLSHFCILSKPVYSRKYYSYCCIRV